MHIFVFITSECVERRGRDGAPVIVKPGVIVGGGAGMCVLECWIRSYQLLWLLKYDHRVYFADRSVKYTLVK